MADELTRIHKHRSMLCCERVLRAGDSSKVQYGMPGNWLVSQYVRKGRFLLLEEGYSGVDDGWLW